MPFFMTLGRTTWWVPSSDSLELKRGGGDIGDVLGDIREEFIEPARSEIHRSGLRRYI